MKRLLNMSDRKPMCRREGDEWEKSLQITTDSLVLRISEQIAGEKKTRLGVHNTELVSAVRRHQLQNDSQPFNNATNAVRYSKRANKKFGNVRWQM